MDKASKEEDLERRGKDIKVQSTEKATEKVKNVNVCVYV